jgi:heat shock protein HslJ
LIPPYIALLTEGNRIKGFSGFNNLKGIYNVEESHIEFLQMASTGKACIDGMEQEQSFLSALEGSKRYRISGDRLSLHGADGRLFLRFEAVYVK